MNTNLIKVYGNKKLMYYNYIFMFLTALDGIVIPSLIAGIITSVEKRDMNLLIYFFIFGLVGYFVVRTGLFLWDIHRQKFINEFNVNAKSDLLEVYFKNHSFVEKDKQVYNIMVNDLKLLETNYINAYFTYIYCSIFALVSAIYVLYVDYRLGIMFVLFSILPTLTAKVFKKRIRENTERWTNHNGDFVNHLKEYLDGFFSISQYKSNNIFSKMIIKKLVNVESSLYQMNSTIFKSKWVANIISGISTFVPLFIGSIFVINGDVTLAGLMAVYLASDRIISPTVAAIECYNRMNSTLSIREQFCELKESLDESGELEGNQPLDRVFPIQFTNVFKKYNGVAIFEDLNFVINRNDRILLKGDSGSGKTTFFKLIQKIIKRDSGDISYNDQSIDEVNFNHISDKIGYFQQTPYLFEESILFNITMGKEFDKQKLEKVIAACQLLSLVENKGLDFNVGYKGENLSGGQKIRVALARLMINDYELVLLDEFSSGLDYHTHNQIRDIIIQNIPTFIEISHESSLNMEYYTHLYEVEDQQIYLKPLVSKEKD